MAKGTHLQTHAIRSAKAHKLELLKRGADLANPLLERRVQRNVSEFKLQQCSEERRTALRYLCSVLASLENVAISAAVHIHGAPGQLEDEIVHKRTFEQIAISLGGIAEIPVAARELVAYVHRLCGRTGAEATNILAEVWVSTLFSHLTRVPELKSVLREIQKDEDRHVAHARQFGKIKGFEVVVWEMERLLAALTATPLFAFPLAYLLGAEGAARIGLDLISVHNRVLRSQRLNAGPEARAVLRTCRAAISVSRKQPRLVDMSDWDLQRQRLRFIGTMDAEYEVAAQPGPAHRVEARVIKAVAEAMAAVPEVNRTLRAGKLYRPLNVCVGVRRLYRDTRVPFTVQIVNAHLKSDRQIIRLIARRLRRANARPYLAGPMPGDLLELGPPSRYAIVVTFTAAHAKNRRMRRGVGFSPLVDGEGCAGSVTIGSAAAGVMNLGFRMDHRHFDGEVMVRFMDEVGDALERGSRKHRGCVTSGRAADMRLTPGRCRDFPNELGTRGP